MINIELIGYGNYQIDFSKNFEDLKKILNVDDDFLLDIINNFKNCKAFFCISINIPNIEKEGRLPYSYIQTNIGLKRFNDLKNKKII